MICGYNASELVWFPAAGNTLVRSLQKICPKQYKTLMKISSKDLIYSTAIQLNTSQSAEFFKGGEVKYI